MLAGAPLGVLVATCQAKQFELCTTLHRHREKRVRVGYNAALSLGGMSALACLKLVSNCTTPTIRDGQAQVFDGRQTK